MNTRIGYKIFQHIPRCVAKFRENRPRDVEKSVYRKKKTKHGQNVDYQLLYIYYSLPLSLERYVGDCNTRLSWRRGTARRPASIEILLPAAQLYEKSHTERLAIGEWPRRSVKVTGNSAVRWAIYCL